MKSKGQMQLRPLRVFSYLVLFLLDIILFYVLRSYFLMVTAVLLAIFPFLSVFGMRKLAGALCLEIGTDGDVIVRNDTLLLELRLKNPIWYAALDSGISLKLSNAFLESGDGLKVSMPVKAHDVSTLLLPVQLTRLGRFRIACEHYQVQDLLGMFYVQLPCRVACEVNVIPEKKPEQEVEISGYLSGMAETEESREKGSDFAEVSDIREYIPGDRIRDIHWKLSAKQDALMVKERVSMAGSEMMLLLKLSADPEETQQVLSRGFYLAQAFTEQRIPVCLLCWNQPMYEFEEFSCSLGPELVRGFCGIYAVPLGHRVQEQQEQYMRNCYPFLGTYLLVQAENGEVQVVMRDNA